ILVVALPVPLPDAIVRTAAVGVDETPDELFCVFLDHGLLPGLQDDDAVVCLAPTVPRKKARPVLPVAVYVLATGLWDTGDDGIRADRSHGLHACVDEPGPGVGARDPQPPDPFGRITRRCQATVPQIGPQQIAVGVGLGGRLRDGLAA